MQQQPEPSATLHTCIISASSSQVATTECGIILSAHLHLAIPTKRKTMEEEEKTKLVRNSFILQFRC